MPSAPARQAARRAQLPRQSLLLPLIALSDAHGIPRRGVPPGRITHKARKILAGWPHDICVENRPIWTAQAPSKPRFTEIFAPITAAKSTPCADAAPETDAQKQPLPGHLNMVQKAANQSCFGRKEEGKRRGKIRRDSAGKIRQAALASSSTRVSQISRMRSRSSVTRSVSQASSSGVMR